MEASLAHFFWKFSSPHRIIVLSTLHVAISFLSFSISMCMIMSLWASISRLHFFSTMSHM